MAAGAGSGLLVPPGDGQNIADAVVRLYTDPALRNAIALEARRRSEDYRVTVVVNRYLELHGEIDLRLTQGVIPGT